MLIRLFWQHTTALRHTHIQNLVVALVLAITIALFYWRPIVRGEALVPTDLLFIYAAFQKAAPEGFTGPSNPQITDPVFKFYPWQVVARETLEERQFPLWNPYQFSGTPLLANGESAFLYPLNLLGLPLTILQAWNLSILLRTFIAGYGMYLFTRSIGVSVLGAVLSTLAFAFSASMTVWLNYPVSYAYSWMPLQLYLCERLIQRRALMDTVVTGIIIAFHLLGGHIQTSFMIMLVWGAYGVFRIVSDYRAERMWRQMIQRLALLALACVVGMMLAAVMLVPFGEWLFQGSELQRRVEGRSINLIDPDLGPNIMSLVTVLIPNVLGNPTWGSGENFAPTNFIEQTIYVGILPLAFASLAIAELRCKADSKCAMHRGRIVFFALLGGISLALAIRLPLFDLINHLPLFNVVAYPRYRLIFTFCAAVLAGYGMDIFITSDERKKRQIARGLLVFAAIAIIWLLSILATLIVFREMLTVFNRIRIQYELMLRAYEPLNLAMYTPVYAAGIFGMILIFARRFQINTAVITRIIIGVTFADLALFGSGINPSLPPDRIYPTTPIIETMRRGLVDHPQARVVGLYDTMPGNTGMPYSLYDITGTDFPPRHYTEVALLAGATQPSSFRLAFPRLDPRIASMLGVRYIVAFDWPEGWSGDQLRLVYRDEHALVYENLGVLPRAYLVERAIVAKDREALEMLASPDFDPVVEVVIDRPPPVPLTSDKPAAGTVTFVSYSANRVVLQAVVQHDSMLFLSDTYYPGWRALVDGAETSIYRANHAFRAVYLPAGSHIVEFVYDPPTFRLGLGITTTGLVLAGLLLLWERRRLSATRALKSKGSN